MPDLIYNSYLPYTQIPLWLFIYVVFGVVIGYYIIRTFNQYLLNLINYLLLKIPGEKPRDIERINKNTVFNALILCGVNIIARYEIAGKTPNDWLIHNSFYKFWIVVTYISFVLVISKYIKYLITIYLHKKDNINGLDRPVDPTLRSLFTIVFNIILYVFAFFHLLALLQIKPTSIVASASVTAIILGFALQNVLADIFSSLSIYLDQPFKVGDHIKVGAESGRVMKIGFKSTRLKTEHGEELSISNVELSKAQVKNFEKLYRRMVELEIEIYREEKDHKAPDLPAIFENTALNFDNVKFENCNLGGVDKDFFLFKAQYFALTPSIKEHHQIKEKLIRDLLKNCNKYKIGIKVIK